MRNTTIALALGLALLLAACGAQSPAAPSGAAPTQAPNAAPTAPPGATAAPTLPPATAYPAPPAGDGDAYPAPTAPDASTSEGARAELESQARARLAQHLGVAESALTLASGARQEWPDSSLGCPDPAVTYMQVIMPGYKLEFSDGARSYAVHTTLSALPGEPMVYCDQATPVDLSVAQAEPNLDPAGQAMLQRAVDDLAAFLQIAPGEVRVSQAQAVEWNDSSLGCPKPDGTYLQVITPGYRIELFAKEKLYTYHTDSQSVVVRCEQP